MMIHHKNQLIAAIGIHIKPMSFLKNNFKPMMKINLSFIAITSNTFQKRLTTVKTKTNILGVSPNNDISCSKNYNDQQSHAVITRNRRMSFHS